MQPEEISEKYNQAMALSAQGKFNASIELLAPHVSDQVEDKELLANMRYLMGLDHWRVGLYNDAVVYFEKSLVQLKELRLYKRLPSIKNSLGLIQRKSGDYRDALVHFLEGLFYAFQFPFWLLAAELWARSKPHQRNFELGRFLGG